MRGRFGLGAELSSLLKPLTLALKEGAPFLEPRFPRAGCPDGPWFSSCLGLHPSVPCTPAAQGPSTGRIRLIDAANHSASVGAYVPPPYAGRKSLFWLTGQLLARLVRPAPPLHRWLRKQRSAWGWVPSRKVLGLHVRRGDTCRHGQDGKVREGRVEQTKGRRCEGLDVYAPFVRDLVRAHGLDAVYLATDDAKIAEQAVSRSSPPLLGVPETAVFVLPLNRTMYAQNTIDGAMRHRDQGLFDFAADARGFFADIMLLAQADAHVGKFTSNLFRHAVALSNALKGGDCVVPYVSLDSLWCADYAQLTGRSLLHVATAPGASDDEREGSLGGDVADKLMKFKC